MKNILKTALCIFPGLLLAHPGHPGSATHGDLTHALMGFFISIPVLATVWLLLRARNRRAAHQPVQKETRNG